MRHTILSIGIRASALISGLTAKEYVKTSQSDGAPKLVSMDDLKALEANFKSSMDAEMLEFRNMFLELKRGQAAPPPLRIEESDLSSEVAKAKAAIASGETPGAEDDPSKNKNGSTSSPKVIITRRHTTTLGGNRLILLYLTII